MKSTKHSPPLHGEPVESRPPAVTAAPANAVPRPPLDPAAGASQDALTVPPASPTLTPPGEPLAAGTLDGESPLPVIAGYEILGILGRGGMGVVYHARQSGLNRLVALKMIRAGAWAGEDERRRFVNEAQAVARLRHPNIVQIHQIGDHEGLPYFSLEYCAAGSLAARLNGTPLAPADAAHVVQTLAVAMQTAHDAGIIHRDLKPANVLLQIADCRLQIADGPSDKSATCNLQSAIPKITDFGLAKKLDEAGQTVSGAILGTPSYMAPEQARGESRQHGPSADIYALGAILYECLTGRPPFKGTTPLDTVLAVVSTEPVPPAQLNPRVPRDLETICMKCLQKAPARRYASAAALAEDLRRFQAGESIRARPVGQLERAVKWARKRPAAAALAGVLVLFAVTAVAASFWYQQLRLDQAQEQARLQVRKAGVENDIRAALEESESRRQVVHAKLADPITTSALNSELDGWRITLDQVQAAWKRADRLAAGNADILPPELAARVQTLGTQLQADQADWQLARELDDIRLEGFRLVDRSVDRSQAGPRFASVFARLGLDFDHGDPAPLAARIREQRMRFVLVAALDYWASVAGDTKVLLPRLLETSRRADPHPWRDQVRDVRNWFNKDKLEQLAAKAVLAEQSPQFLGALVVHLRSKHSDPTALLTGALRLYPRDFWLNFLRGTALKAPAAQSECYRSCLILRPGSALVHSNLGAVLRKSGDLEGAIFHLKKAIALDPAFAGAHLNLANALNDHKEMGRALRHYHQAIALDPALAMALDLKFAQSRLQRALQLQDQGKFERAYPLLQEAHALGSPRSDWNHPSAQLLKECKRLLALDQQRAAVLAGKAQPASADESLQLADLCLRYKKQYAAAARFFAAGFKQAPGLADAGTKDLHLRAARAAVLAGTGQGTDAEALSDRERAAWRQQARTWLQADLHGHVAAIQAGELKALLAAEETLTRMRRAPALATVREPQQLAGLPEDEQRAWQGLWHEIDDALQKAAQRFMVAERKGVLGPPQREIVFAVKMKAGRTYVIDLASNQFAPALRLEEATGKIRAASDDSSPNSHTSRLLFTPPAGGTYRVMATSVQQQGRGAYTLRIREARRTP
jgi:tetratricopeptide (TPR) repeat protein